MSNRITRAIKRHLQVSAKYTLLGPAPGIKLKRFPKTKNTYNNQTFTFLNREKTFTNGINWNFDEYGKLWTYHLNYLDCLVQKDIDHKEAIDLLLKYIQQEDQQLDGHEPYPTSLRLINCIKLLSQENIKDSHIDSWIGKQAILLQNNLEYHLLGNHLLENGFALLFAAFHLRDMSLYQTSSMIILQELDEQILTDGAHFELSPMYHMIIFSRVLDAINLVSSNDSFDDILLQTLKDKGVMMLTWLENMMVNGKLPMVNDSYDLNEQEIQRTINYANDLGLFRHDIPLGNSGYRMIRKSDYSLLFDIGNIGPDYIPGHAHADSLQFLLWARQKEMIVDTGVSTYERNEVRQGERSTSAHNTIVVEEVNSSEVWSSFRVGARAKILDVIETTDSIEASHDGYQYFGAVHQRKITCYDHEIVITDKIMSVKKYRSKSYLHFHPNARPVLKNNKIWTEDFVISFQDEQHIELLPYQFASSYGKTIPAVKAIISFSDILNTRIQIH